MPINVFITGGTSGIGYGLARHYLAQGCRVGICSRNGIDDTHKNLYVYSLDVANRNALDKALADFCATLQLDILIVSAGIYCNDITDHPSVQQQAMTLSTNISGTVNTLEAAAQYMQQNGGRMAIIASISGMMDYPQSTLYAKSKRAVITICDAYRQLFAAGGVTLTCVLPGYTDTTKLRELNANDLSRKPFLVTTDYAVHKISGALERGISQIAFPSSMYRLVKFLTILPKPLLAWIMLKNKRRDGPRKR